MKKRLVSGISALLLTTLMATGTALVPARTVSAAGGTEINATNFPDENFRKYVSENCDKDGNGELSMSEREAVLSINVSDKGISNLKGLGYFYKLYSLNCSHNELTELDVDGYGRLTRLDCSYNKLTKLNFTQEMNLTYLNCEHNEIRLLNTYFLTGLQELICNWNMLQQMDFTQNTELTKLYCGTQPLHMSIDISKNLKLRELECSGLGIYELDVSKHTQLETLICHDNRISELNISNNTKLKYLNCGECPNLKELDVSHNRLLETLLLSGNENMKSIDISKNKELKCLGISDIPLSNVNVDHLAKLQILNCGGTNISSLNVSNNTMLEILRFQNNNLTSVDLSNNTKLRILNCSGNKLKTIDISNNPDLIKASQGTKSYLPKRTDVIKYYTEWDVNEIVVDASTQIIASNSSAVPTTAPTSAPATPTTAPTDKPVKPTAAPVDSKTQIAAFVDRIYEYVLDREPEEAGAAFWCDELYNFKRSGAEVAQGFIFSPEFENRKTSDKEFVTILYKTFFGREPDEDGMNFWLAQLQLPGVDRVMVANGFIYSQEWANTCMIYGIRSGGDVQPTVKVIYSTAISDFVKRMYTTALGRDYDKEGLKYWANELVYFRVTGEQLGVLFFLSEEMESLKLDDKEFVNRLYLTFMDREADEAGFEYWNGILATGFTRLDIVLGFTRSPEFVQKCIDARIMPYL